MIGVILCNILGDIELAQPYQFSLQSFLSNLQSVSVNAVSLHHNSAVHIIAFSTCDLFQTKS